MIWSSISREAEVLNAHGACALWDIHRRVMAAISHGHSKITHGIALVMSTGWW